MLDGSKYGRKTNDDYLSASDEEILPLEGLSDEDDNSEDDDDDEVSDGQDDDRSQLDEEEELDNEAWGSSRKAYYGADDVSDEEDERLEEQEAERLQKKHLARLQPEDFLDTWADTIAATADRSQTTTGRYVTEELPAPDLSKLSQTERVKLLKSRHPEVSRLAGLYSRLYPELSSLGLLVQRPFHPQHEIIKLQFASLSVLLSSIAIFFALRADTKERKSTEKKMIGKISEMEKTWAQISSIQMDKNAVDVQDVIATETKLDNLIAQPKSSAPAPKKDTTLKRKRQAKTLADDVSDDDLTETLALLKKSRKTKPKPLANDLDDDFAESKFLHSVDAQEKSQNRKSLQFYAAQIAQKGAKRREKYSGDMEVFKERRNDRNERQIEEARKRGLPSKDLDDTALGTSEPNDDDETQPPQRNVDDDDYYDFIATKAAKKKATGKEDYESSKAAARAYLLGMTDEGELDESGKRLITRQIEKNKGLTPKRSKDVRNPRVKKRKKYEKKKIALKGRQQVYQVNDRRRGNYGGEESGINKNVVRGIKLQ